MCSEFRRDFRVKCPCCNGDLLVTHAGLYCQDCGYLKRTISEDTLEMTEVRKPGERIGRPC